MFALWITIRSINIAPRIFVRMTLYRRMSFSCSEVKEDVLLPLESSRWHFTCCIYCNTLTMNCIILYVVKTERCRQSVGLKWGYFAKMYVLRKKKKKKQGFKKQQGFVRKKQRLRLQSWLDTKWHLIFRLPPVWTDHYSFILAGNFIVQSVTHSRDEWQRCHIVKENQKKF